jgi:hypothetical protein
MPVVARLYFRTAIVFLIAGISIGLHMSIAQDHSATGAHAHVNLLGWVTMALFGGYHALNPQKAAGRLAMVQYVTYTLGVGVMTPSLYLMLTGNAAMEPVVAVSSLITFAGAILFAVIVFTGREGTATARAG